MQSPFYSSPLPGAQDLLFRQWAASHFRAAREMRRLTLQLLSAFDRLWPGALVDVPRFQRAHPNLSPPVPLVHSKPRHRPPRPGLRPARPAPAP